MYPYKKEVERQPKNRFIKAPKFDLLLIYLRQISNLVTFIVSYLIVFLQSSDKTW
jgi:hypothetical protein